MKTPSVRRFPLLLLILPTPSFHLIFSMHSIKYSIPLHSFFISSLLLLSLSLFSPLKPRTDPPPPPPNIPLFPPFYSVGTMPCSSWRWSFRYSADGSYHWTTERERSRGLFSTQTFVALLLHFFLSIHIPIQWHATALWYASHKGHFPVVEWLLLTYGGRVDINAPDHVRSIPPKHFGSNRVSLWFTLHLAANNTSPWCYR